jgi:hypothetical protein
MTDIETRLRERLSKHGVGFSGGEKCCQRGGPSVKFRGDAGQGRYRVGEVDTGDPVLRLLSATYACSVASPSRCAMMSLPGASAIIVPLPTASALALWRVSQSKRKVSMKAVPTYAGFASERSGRILDQAPSAMPRSTHHSGLSSFLAGLHEFKTEIEECYPDYFDYQALRFYGLSLSNRHRVVVAVSARCRQKCTAPLPQREIHDAVARDWSCHRCGQCILPNWRGREPDPLLFCQDRYRASGSQPKA